MPRYDAQPTCVSTSAEGLERPCWYLREVAGGECCLPTGSNLSSGFGKQRATNRGTSRSSMAFTCGCSWDHAPTTARTPPSGFSNPEPNCGLKGSMEKTKGWVKFSSCYFHLWWFVNLGFYRFRNILIYIYIHKYKYMYLSIYKIYTHIYIVLYFHNIAIASCWADVSPHRCITSQMYHLTDGKKFDFALASIGGPGVFNLIFFQPKSFERGPRNLVLLRLNVHCERLGQTPWRCMIGGEKVHLFVNWDATYDELGIFKNRDFLVGS